MKDIMLMLKLVGSKVLYNYFVDKVKDFVPVGKDESKEVLAAAVIYFLATRYANKIGKEIALVLRVEAATDVIQQVLNLVLPDGQKDFTKYVEGNDDYKYSINADGEATYINNDMFASNKNKDMYVTGL